MSVLKTIVIYSFALNLALLLVPNIEISNGVFLNDAFITAGQIEAPIDTGTVALNDMKAALSGVGYVNRTTILCIGDYIGPLSFLTAGQGCFMVPYSNNPSDLERVFIFILSILTLVFILISLLFNLIYNSTVGAVFLYSNLFSLIDPVFGSMLGLTLGSLQAVLVVWGLTAFIPTISNKEA